MKRRNKSEKTNLTTELIGIAIPCLVAMAAVRDWFFNWGTTPDEEFGSLSNQSSTSCIALFPITSR
jgi:hypothetical protein